MTNDGPRTDAHYTAIMERCPDTGLWVGYIPGFPGAHSQGETLDALDGNTKEVTAIILDDRAPETADNQAGAQNSDDQLRGKTGCGQAGGGGGSSR